MIILTHEQIVRTITRLAYQIYEEHVGSKEIIIAGIKEQGYFLAEKIAKELTAISDLKIDLASVSIVKTNPTEETTEISISAESIKGKSVVIVDDVLNTARTMVYAIYPFFKANAATISTMVLADRNHKKFPVSADFTGISLATTLQQHITFEVNSDKSMQLSLN
jgi:pyrimidine operon attenuation protein/uracil phosphoribosyltransferase